MGSMKQSQQDDVFDDLQLFAETTYLNLVLAALKRTLNEDEVAILGRVIRLVSDKLFSSVRRF